MGRACQKLKLACAGCGGNKPDPKLSIERGHLSCLKAALKHWEGRTTQICHQANKAAGQCGSLDSIIVLNASGILDVDVVAQAAAAAAEPQLQLLKALPLGKCHTLNFLHTASRRGHICVLEDVLERGFHLNFNQCSEPADSHLDAGASWLHMQTAPFLHDCRPEALLSSAAAGGNINFFKLMASHTLAEGQQLRSSVLCSLISNAASSSNPDMIIYLCARWPSTRTASTFAAALAQVSRLHLAGQQSAQTMAAIMYLMSQRCPLLPGIVFKHGNILKEATRHLSRRRKAALQCLPVISPHDVWPRIMQEAQLWSPRGHMLDQLWLWAASRSDS